MEGKYVELPDGAVVWAVWREETKEWIAVRKITPIEAARLQGIDDETTKKWIAEGISDTQIYRGVGDAVSIPVVLAIAKKIIAIDKMEKGDADPYQQ